MDVGRCVLAACRNDLATQLARNCPEVNTAADPTGHDRCLCSSVGRAAETCRLLACFDDTVGASADGRLKVVVAMKKWVLGLLLASGLSCGAPVMDPDRRDRGPNPVGSISVDITSGDRGTPTMPLAFSDVGVTFGVHIEVRDDANALMTGFNDYLNLSVTPGVLRSITSADPNNVLGRNIRMNAGVADIQVTFARAYGEVRI